MVSRTSAFKSTRPPARPLRPRPQHVREDALASWALSMIDAEVLGEAGGVEAAGRKVLAGLLGEGQDGPDRVVDVVGDGPGQRHQARPQLGGHGLPLERELDLHVPQRDGGRGQEALDHLAVLADERVPLRGRDLQQPQELAVEEERGREDALGGGAPRPWW